MKYSVGLTIFSMLMMCFGFYNLGKIVTMDKVERSVEAAEPVPCEPVAAPEVAEVNTNVNAPETFKTFMFTIQVVTGTPEASNAARERLCKLCGVLKSVKDIENAAPVALYGVYKDEAGKTVSVELDL